jgi:hypothetical protein
MNYIEKQPKRYTSVLFENGRMTFHYLENKLIIEDFNNASIDVKTCPEVDRNDLFISESEDFFKRIQEKHCGISSGLKRAFEIVKICIEND